jgi:hypothetical protein
MDKTSEVSPPEGNPAFAAFAPLRAIEIVKY